MLPVPFARLLLASVARDEYHHYRYVPSESYYKDAYIINRISYPIIPIRISDFLAPAKASTAAIIVVNRPINPKRSALSS